MKKAIVILLAMCLLFLVGCNREKPSEALAFSFGEGVSDITVTKNGEFEPYTVSGAELSDLLARLNAIRYKENGAASVEEANGFEYDYIVFVGNYVIAVKGNSLLFGKDGAFKLCEVCSGDFSFLGEIEFEPVREKLSDLIGFGEDEISDLTLENVGGGFTVDVSANTHLKELLLSVCYDSVEEMSPDADYDMPDPKYILNFGDGALSVFESNTVCYTDAESDIQVGFIKIYGNAFAYLDTVTEGEITSRDGYSEDAEIKAYNDKNYVAEITEKAEFLASLNEVKLIKLSCAEHYTLGKQNYTVKIGDEVIKIYGNYVTIGNELFAVTEGDFGFLSELTYSSSSSGFLPWI